eukprot:scpid93133/ scgid2442/ Paired box protein Pax-5; B-cell-specific transcription factor
MDITQASVVTATENSQISLAAQAVKPREGVNQLGGYYRNGKPLDSARRARVIEMHRHGVKPCMISRQLRISHGCVSKLIKRYKSEGTMAPGKIGGSSPKVMKPEVVEYVEQVKGHTTTSTWTAERIRVELIRNKVCEAGKCPSISSINRTIRTIQKNSMSGGSSQTAQGQLQVPPLPQNPEQGNMGSFPPPFQCLGSVVGFSLCGTSPNVFCFPPAKGPHQPVSFIPNGHAAAGYAQPHKAAYDYEHAYALPIANGGPVSGVSPLTL